MIATPWWAAALIGVLTVVGAGFAAWVGANRTTEATRQKGTRSCPRGMVPPNAMGRPDGAV